MGLMLPPCPNGVKPPLFETGAQTALLTVGSFGASMPSCSRSDSHWPMTLNVTMKEDSKQ